MDHDPGLVERLSRFPTAPFAGEVFRATRKGREPLAPSARGGRWAPPEEVAVLYTSMAREGALAEIVFHWGQLTPLPSRPAVLHRIRLTAGKTLRLIQADLAALGVTTRDYHRINYERTQMIGAAVGYLGHDGLIVPSARWDCENLVLFPDNHGIEHTLQVVDSEVIDWQAWAREHGFLDPA